MMLERGGVTALEAACMDEAYDVAIFAGPDVLIADERVVRRDGSTFRRLTSHPRLGGMLVVALSAGVQRRRALIGGGAHAVVGKPVLERNLIAAVRWVLDVYRGRATTRTAGRG